MNRIGMADRDERWMKQALEQAEAALAEGEFPVGCVIADTERIVARGHRTGTAMAAANEIDHAEINALRQLGGVDNGADRSQLTLYATMEPCLMCFSAILLSRISRVVFAYEDVMGGGAGCDRSTLAPLYRDAVIQVVPGVLRSESLRLFQHFFRQSGNTYWSDSLLCRYTLDQVCTEESTRNG